MFLKRKVFIGMKMTNIDNIKNVEQLSQKKKKKVCWTIFNVAVWIRFSLLAFKVFLFSYSSPVTKSSFPNMLVKFIIIALKSNNFFQIKKHLNFQQITQLYEIKYHKPSKKWKKKNCHPKKGVKIDNNQPHGQFWEKKNAKNREG